MELFKIFGTIALNNSQANKELDDTTDKAKSAGSKIAAALGKVGAAVGKASLAVAGAAAAGAAALAKGAVESYGDYEQLVGGVETLFGTGGKNLEEYAESVGKTVSEVSAEYDKLMTSQQTVLTNAANAYKTAGLSANEYMDTVTGFSASLLQGLDGDTEAAAEIANQAITDMADNANKMGTDMTAIQNAYQGFAKQNYTMLDNLKLGYGGTASEMARLINDSGVLGDTMTVTAETVNEVSFDKMIEAIHVVQDNLGITGTTALEAATTIQGSVASMKSAWQNLLTGIADDSQDFGLLVNNFVDSTATAASNILPRIETALNGIGTLIEKMAPIIAEAIPNVLSTVLPKMLAAGVSMVQSLIAGISANIGLVSKSAVQIIMMLVKTIVGMLPDIINMGVELLIALIDGLTSNQDELITTIAEIIGTIVSTLVAAIPRLLDSGVNLLKAIIEGLVKTLPQLLAAAGDIVGSLLKVLFEAVMDFFGVGEDIVQKIEDGIASAWQGLCDWFSGIWSSLFGGLNVNVGVTGTGGGGSAGGGGGRGGNPGGTGRGMAGVGRYASGLDRVPYDDFPAYLHKDEMIVPAGQADYLRAGAFSQRSEEQTARIINVLSQILDAVKDVDASGMAITLDRREFGRAVRAVT